MIGECRWITSKLARSRSGRGRRIYYNIYVYVYIFIVLIIMSIIMLIQRNHTVDNHVDTTHKYVCIYVRNMLLIQRVNMI